MRMARLLMITALVIALAGSIAIAGCGGGDDDGDGGGEKVSGPPPPAPERIKLRSTAIEDGGTMPTLYTCDGAELSPPLKWSGVPKGTQALAIEMDDLDSSGDTVVHWTMFNFSPEPGEFGEAQVPTDAKQGKNSFGDEIYRGPCPPEGDPPHRYVFALYALSAPLALEQGASATEFRKALGPAAVARGTLTVRFGR